MEIGNQPRALRLWQRSPAVFSLQHFTVSPDVTNGLRGRSLLITDDRARAKQGETVVAISG